jgi:hypothetical protein
MEFTINIEGKEYKVPETYTVGEWTKLTKWRLDDINDWPFLLSAALGAPVGPLLELKGEDEELFTFMLSIVFSGLQVIGRRFEYEIEGYKFLDLEGMTVGKWIDLDVWASENGNFDKLFAELYGMPIEVAREIQVTRAQPAVKRYQDWRRSVYRSYKELFGFMDINPEETGERDNTTMSPAHAWYETVMVLSDGKFENIEYAVSRPFREAFNFLAWKKTKMLEERMEIMKMKRKFAK